MNHSHVLYDSDPHFIIDPTSRRIINESSSKTLLIQHDHNSERFTFEIPRYIEGHDMASCNLVEIHYANVEGNTKVAKGGVYTVDDLQIKSDDENVVVCSWLIPNNATQLVGTLQFLVRFSCVNESTAKVEYVWNTGIYGGITVSSGIYNSDSPSDNPVPPYNFITTVSGDKLKFFIGDQEEFNELPTKEDDVLYIFTDDATMDEIERAIDHAGHASEDAVNALTELNELRQDLEDGDLKVDQAVEADTARHADKADTAVSAETAVFANKASIVGNGGSTVYSDTPTKLSYQLPCCDENNGVYLVTMYNATYVYVDIIYINYRRLESYGCGGKVSAHTDANWTTTTITSTENVHKMKIQKIAEGVA